MRLSELYSVHSTPRSCLHSFYAIPICSSTIDNFFVCFQQRFVHHFGQKLETMIAYSEELIMFTVHHYSPVPFFHVYTCMCIYPDCDKMKLELILSLWLVQYGILTSMSTRICSTATIAVSHGISVCRQGAVTMPELSLDRIKCFSAYQSARGPSYHILCR